MKNLIKASILTVLSFVSAQAFSQTTIYVGSNRAYGIAWGGANQRLREQTAYNYCVSNGGQNCKMVYAVAGKGYGAIARGTNNALGWASGQPSQQAANNAAVYMCKQNGGTNPRVEKNWVDR